jgi:hypothetical protein
VAETKPFEASAGTRRFASLRAQGRAQAFSRREDKSSRAAFPHWRISVLGPSDSKTRSGNTDQIPSICFFFASNSSSLMTP